MKNKIKTAITTVKEISKKINTGRKLKAIVKSHLKANGYKIKAVFVPTSYRNGFVHLRAGNKDNEFIELHACMEGKDNFFAGDIRVTTNSIIRIAKNTWQAENDEKITHYVL